jgi:ABC-type lipoprotein export system ATPase subunit
LNSFHALKDINLTFGNTGMNFILGKSGSGKSTLLNVIGGIDSYDSGDLLIDNLSTNRFSASDYNNYRNTYIGFVFQEFNVLKGLNVYDNIALSLELHRENLEQKEFPDQNETESG